MTNKVTVTIRNCYIHYVSTCVLLVLNYFSDWLTGIPWSMESSAACSFSDNSRDDFMWAVSAAWFLSCTSLITAYHCRSLVGKNCWKEQQIFHNCKRICSVNRVVIRGVTHNMNWRKITEHLFLFQFQIHEAEWLVFKSFVTCSVPIRDISVTIKIQSKIP